MFLYVCSVVFWAVAVCGAAAAGGFCAEEVETTTTSAARTDSATANSPSPLAFLSGMQLLLLFGVGALFPGTAGVSPAWTQDSPSRHGRRDACGPRKEHDPCLRQLVCGRCLNFSACLQRHEALERLVDLQIHLRLAWNQTAPAVAATLQVQRQLRGVGVVTCGQQFALRCEFSAESVLDFIVRS